jgi:hypothetical protein
LVDGGESDVELRCRAEGLNGADKAQANVRFLGTRGMPNVAIFLVITKLKVWRRAMQYRPSFELCYVAVVFEWMVRVPTDGKGVCSGRLLEKR